MPAKLQKLASPPKEKPEAPAKVIASPRPKAPASQREYAALRLFLSQDAGFRLALATYDRPATRDGLMARLVDDLAKSQLLLSILNVAEGEGSLLLRLEKHLADTPTPTGWRRAVVVVNLEDRLTYSDVPVKAGDAGGRDLTFLEEANLHRDAFPKVCPFPLLLWLTELAESALAKNAPDLWHWRNARFDFEREGSFLADFHAHPTERVAWYQHIAAASNRLGDKQGEIGDLLELGIAKLEMGDARGAMKHFEDALARAREIGDKRGEGTALGNLGIAYAKLGHTRKAIEFFQQRLGTARQFDDRWGEANALMNIASAHYLLGEAKAAIPFYEQALYVFRQIRERRGESNVLNNLGLIYYELNEAKKAIDFIWEALVISHEIGNRLGEGAGFGNLGLAYAALGEHRKAAECYEKHLAIAREIGDRQGESNALGNLGLVFFDLGKTCESINFYDQQLVISREIGDRRGQGIALFNSARALNKLGDWAKAIARAEDALKIYEAIEDPNAARVRAQLAEWHSAGLKPSNPPK